MATKRHRKRFTVEGSGVFPFDMLRYDACWPESEARDSYKLDAQRLQDKEAFGRRQVTLLTDSLHAPTHGRWQSFTWRVVSEEYVTW